MGSNKKILRIGIICALIAFGAISAAVWWLYTPHQTTTLPSAQTQSQPQSATKNTLNITELSAQITLNEKTKGTTYVPAKDANAVFIIDPTMKALDSTNEQCQGPTAGMIGLLERSTNINHWGSPITPDNITSFKIGDYYYLFRGPQAECSQNAATSEKRANSMQNFIETLTTIQPYHEK